MKPLKQTSFGSEDGALAIKFHNDTEVVIGFIVKQTGTGRFVVSDGIVTKTCYLAQTTVEAQNLTGTMATIEATTVGGIVYIKKMTANYFTSTEGDIYLWQRDPDEPGKGQVTLLGDDVQIGPPGWVPPNAIAYGHFGLDQYFAFGVETDVEDFYSSDPRDGWEDIALPLVVDGVLKPQLNGPESSFDGEYYAAVEFGPLRDDILRPQGATIVLDLEFNEFDPDWGASVMINGYGSVVGNALILEASLIDEGVVGFSFQFDEMAALDRHVIEMVHFTGTTVRVAATIGPNTAISVNGSEPTTRPWPEGANIDDNLDMFLMQLYGEHVGVSDLTVYPELLGDDLKQISQLDRGNPTWLEPTLIAEADFMHGLYYDGNDLVTIDDVVEIPAPFARLPYHGICAPGVMSLTTRTMTIIGGLKDAILTNDPVTVVIGAAIIGNSSPIFQIGPDINSDIMTLAVTGVDFDNSTATTTFATGNAPAVSTKSTDPMGDWSSLHYFAFHINGTSVLTSHNGNTSAGITLSQPDPFENADLVRLTWRDIDRTEIMTSIKVFSGVKDQTQLNELTGYPAWSLMNNFF